MHMRTDGPRIYAQHIRDLHIAESLEVEESEARSLHFRQSLDRRGKSFRRLAPFGVVVGTPLLRSECLGQVSHLPPPPPRHQVSSEVAEDREKPRSKRTALIEVLHAPECPVERLLDKILRIVPRVGELQRDRQRWAQVPAHESIKRPGISILGAPSEFFVRKGREITAHKLPRMPATFAGPC